MSRILTAITEVDNSDHIKGVAEAQDLEESFDQPYKLKWYPGDMDEVTAYAEIPNGDDLSIMFNLDANEEGEEAWAVEFYRNNSQEVTGEGDAQRIFATVLSAIKTFIKKYKPNRITFSASKDNWAKQQQGSYSRVNLYDRLVQRYARTLGYKAFRADTGDKVIYELSKIAKQVAEGSGKNVVKSVKVGNFRHDLVDTGMGWQVRIYNGDELYDTGMSKNSEQKGLAALEDAVAYTEKQTRTTRQGVAEGSEELVQIEYWQQETMESGRWVKTKPIPRATAEKIVNSFERGEIVDVEQGVAEGFSDISGLLSASNLNKSFIITAELAEGGKKKFRVKAQNERVAVEKFKKHHSMAKIINVAEEGVTEGDSGAKYRIKQIGKDNKGDYYISPSTGKKVYKQAKVGDHENPKTGEHMKKIKEDETLQFAAEVTPKVSPYAGIKDNKFRGAIGEESNYNPVGVQPGGWRKYKLKVNELKELGKDKKEKIAKFRQQIKDLKNKGFYKAADDVQKGFKTVFPGEKIVAETYEYLLYRYSDLLDKHDDSFVLDTIINESKHEDKKVNAKKVIKKLENTSEGQIYSTGGGAGQSQRKYKPKLSGVFEGIVKADQSISR